MYCTNNKAELNVIAKLKEKKVKSLAKKSLEKAFAGTVAPKVNIRIVERMKAKGLTIRNLRSSGRCF